MPSRNRKRNEPTSSAGVPPAAGKLVSLNPLYTSFALVSRETTVGRKTENNVVINNPHGAFHFCMNVWY
jgi:hypothetical protein